MWTYFSWFKKIQKFTHLIIPYKPWKFYTYLYYSNFLLIYFSTILLFYFLTFLFSFFSTFQLFNVSTFLLSTFNRQTKDSLVFFLPSCTLWCDFTSLWKSIWSPLLLWTPTKVSSLVLPLFFLLKLLYKLGSKQFSIYDTLPVQVYICWS